LKLVLSILGEVVVYFRREIGAAGALAEEAEGEEWYALTRACAAANP
jgi:hypothetical protein